LAEKTAQELVAEGLVAALKMEPGKKYIIIFDHKAFTPHDAMKMTQYISGAMKIENCSARVALAPRDAIAGIEIEDCNAPTIRDLEAMPYEEIERMAIKVRGVVPPSNRYEAIDGGRLTMALAEMAYSCCWYGAEYPRLIISTAATIGILLNKIRNGPEVQGDCIGWVYGKCWFHGAKFFVIPDWPLGEMFFFNPFRRESPMFHALITGIRG